VTPAYSRRSDQGAPSGTVTFLFTDIEGSTQLLQRLREQYTVLLADQRRLLRQAFSHWDGHEVDTQGDAFFVAFPRATQAVCAAVEAQRLLAEHAWPDEVALVRGIEGMGPRLIADPGDRFWDVLGWRLATDR